MMMFKRVIFIVILFLVVSFNFFAQEELRLRVPLRFAAGSHQASGLSKENLTLVVNGEKREIVDLIKRERTMAKITGLGKNFILTFHMTEYSSQVKKGISYFVTEIIHPTDSLMVVSPIKIYQINVSGNKEKMIRDIAQLLKNDCHIYKKNRAAVEKNLRRKIKDLRSVLNDRLENATHRGARQILAASQFFNTFPREFIKFRELSLLLDTSKYRKIIDLLGFREGERWWLHFHQEEVAALLSYIRAFMRELEDYVGNWESGFVKKLANLKKVLSISDSFPVKRVLETIVSSNLCYNVISFGGIKIVDQEARETVTSGLSRILTRVAVGSGGKKVGTVNLEQGIREIAGKKDTYYELIFNFNGKIEKKAVKVTAKKRKTKLLYRNGFEQEKLEALVHYLTWEKVKIENFSNRKHLVKFTLNSFKHHKREKFGMLRVKIELFSGQEVAVYSTHNTLRSSQDKVIIRIPLPEKFSGAFRLLITVYDLLANSRVSLDRNITI